MQIKIWFSLFTSKLLSFCLMILVFGGCSSFTFITKMPFLGAEKSNVS